MATQINIVFICGSLEPGRDGVGDYTRRISAELVKLGNQVGIVAINDRHLSEEFMGTQEFSGVVIPILRIPGNLSQNDRFKRAGSWIENFNPKWLSLQFVPFAFHKKGLPFGIGKLLQKLGSGRRWHIMVHELWVGMDREAKLKLRFWGWIQMRLIQSMLKRSKFLRINTQTDLYVKMIERIGFRANYLPLFGNIPLASKPDSRFLSIGENHIETIFFVVFGGIHPGAPIGQFAKELSKYSKERLINFKLKIIGRCGSDQARWVKEWEDQGLFIEVYGEQSNEFISSILSSSTIGISSTPIALIEKSGSFAAMREHGLKVICISRPWNPKGYSNPKIPEGVVEYKQGRIYEILNSEIKKNNLFQASEIAQQFLDHLTMYQ
jgi:hypothetical protein